LALIKPRAGVRLGFQNADGPWELRKLARTNLLAGCDVIKTCVTGGGGTDKEEPNVRNMTQEAPGPITRLVERFQSSNHMRPPKQQQFSVRSPKPQLSGFSESVV
jgi:hypothetical protein